MVCVGVRCVHSAVSVYVVSVVCLYEVCALWSVCVMSGVCLCEVCALWRVCVEFCVCVKFVLCGDYA